MKSGEAGEAVPKFTHLLFEYFGEVRGEAVPRSTFPCDTIALHTDWPKQLVHAHWSIICLCSPVMSLCYTQYTLTKAGSWHMPTALSILPIYRSDYTCTTHADVG